MEQKARHFGGRVICIELWEFQRCMFVFLCDCLTSKATKTIIQASQFLKDRRVVNEWLGKNRELKRTCVPFSSA